MSNENTLGEKAKKNWNEKCVKVDWLLMYSGGSLSVWGYDNKYVML